MTSLAGDRDLGERTTIADVGDLEHVWIIGTETSLTDACRMGIETRAADVEDLGVGTCIADVLRIGAVIYINRLSF